MNTQRLLILGAGGHGKVVGDCAAESRRWAKIVFFDDRWPALGVCGPWPVSGRGADLATQARAGDEVIVAIGDNAARLRWTRQLQLAGLSLATVVHPRAIVSSLAQIGPGSLVVAGAVVNAGAQTGLAVIINTGASVDHDCQLSDGVHIAPGCHLAGNTRVGESTLMGIGAVTRQGTSIGRDTVVGAGAVVVGEVPPACVALGVPAKPVTR